MHSTPASRSKKLAAALIGGITLLGSAPTWAHHSHAQSSTATSFAATIDHLTTPIAGALLLLIIVSVGITRARKR